MNRPDSSHRRSSWKSPALGTTAVVARWLLLPLVAAACIAALSPASTQAQAGGDDGRHMLWEVADGEATAGYLLGSVHYMKPEAYPLDSVYDRAFESADVVAFEVDLDSLQAEAQTLFLSMGTYQDETTLSRVLSDSTWESLETRLGSLGLPAAQMQQFEPWAVALTVTALELQRAGYSPESGVDRHFFDRAREAGKTVVGFETPAEQLRYFDEMTVDLQTAFLRYSLQDAERTMEQFDEIVEAWQAGDADRLADLVQGELDARFPRLYETIVAGRNRTWMPRITELLESDRMPLIVVGAGHISGPDGLATLLREAGFTVEQI
ncbi:MAG: TraB/GumN family protein [Gemmatimonadota bacterium]